nr:PREDICTED: lymphocyte-specific helicase-like [Bemisia tabaci]XP_018902643.1 PREDICTED: lymphocyte-specific helicase-like [Bemisia tabaci]XP_018902644.1 PREDICTED: lymphocyte-specific helicase-like [Bemisia tabaci]XP_018902645.1 PREDICTED: lymphocyte-specific helicase-like [Bemisia tabaci]
METHPANNAMSEGSESSNMTISTEVGTESSDTSGVSVNSFTTDSSINGDDSVNMSGVSTLAIEESTLAVNGDTSADMSGVSTLATSVIEETTIGNDTLNASEVDSAISGSVSRSNTPESFCDFDDTRDQIQNNPLVTKEMVAEEKKLEKQRMKEEMKQEKEFEEKVAEEERSARYNKLMELLTKSKFYGKFIAQQLAAPQPPKDKKPVGKKGRKSKKQDDENKASEENINPVSQESIKTEEENDSQDSQHSMRTRKRKASSSPATTPEQSNGADNAKRARRPPSWLNDYEAKENPSKEPKTEDTEETYITAQGFTASVRQPKLFDGGSLRDYQLDGLDWLKALFENGVNGILADEMGLGKTAQVISFVCHLIEMGATGPFLIIGPLSTLPNWMMEFERFAPKIPVLLFHGYKGERERLRSKFRQKKDVNGKKVFPVILTSYEIPLMERSHMRQFIWKFIIVDEGHRLKNHSTQLAQELRAYNSINRLLLTGTPLQNNLMELWSLLNFLLPELFNDLNAFESWLDISIFSDNGRALIEQEKSNQIVATLQQILAPFMLRRRKVDVEINIPPKKELLVYAPMTTLQQDLYKATIDHTIERLLMGPEKQEGYIIPDNPDGTRARRSCAQKNKDYSFPSMEWYVEQDSKTEPNEISVVDKENPEFAFRIRMQNTGMQLRKIINHPFLIQMPLKPGSGPREILVSEDIVTKSGKLLVLDAMLAKLKKGGHKVLIFSTFCMVLDLLEEYMIMRDYGYRRLDGSRNIEDRMESIKAFNTDPNIFCFLISTRAGGLGINLTAADTVVIFDSDWNPQADLQAQDRCHRIGQTRPVVVYRFVTAGTVDEKIVEVAGRKRKLEKLVIQDGTFINPSSIMKPSLLNLQALKSLLESCDYQKKIQPNGFIFTDEELDALLDRSDLLGDTKGVLKSSNSVFKVLQVDEGQ